MGSTLHNRFGRLLSLLSLLQTGPRYNAVQLAQELDVSRRTIFRDIALLRDLGVPICFDENSDGYSLAPGSVQAVTKALNQDQVESLLLAGHLSALQLVPAVSTAIRDATSNLSGRLSPKARDELSNLMNACVLDFNPRTAPRETGILTTILTAIRRQRQLRLTIAGQGSEPLGTKFAPYRFRIGPDQWRLVGRSSYHRSVHAFDVQTIETAQLTDETFEVPRGFYRRQLEAQESIGRG